jgi:predicted DCC family thiol-disulfide oxidoreductase YuxK
MHRGESQVMEHPVLLYDGVCGFCNRLVQFVLRHDDEKIFRFASLQSSFGSQVLTQHGVDTSAMSTAYVLASGDEGQVLLQRSAAILFLMSWFGGIWSVLAQMVRLLPLRVRDWAYNVIARHRYRIFGRYESCPLPSAADRERFLDL